MTTDHEEAVRLATDIVQHLADSEPTERSMDGMDILRGTTCESMFVLDGDTIRDAIALMIENALTDGLLVTAAKSAALIADARRQNVPDIHWLSNVIRTADGNNTMGAGALAEAIVDAISARLEEGK